MCVLFLMKSQKDFALEKCNNAWITTYVSRNWNCRQTVKKSIISSSIDEVWAHFLFPLFKLKNTPVVACAPLWQHWLPEWTITSNSKYHAWLFFYVSPISPRGEKKHRYSCAESQTSHYGGDITFLPRPKWATFLPLHWLCPSCPQHFCIRVVV